MGKDNIVTKIEKAVSHLQEEYDLEQLYKKQIDPLVNEISRICVENKIPFIATFAISREKSLKTNVVTASNQIQERVFPQYIMILDLLDLLEETKEEENLIDENFFDKDTVH